jgi:hypothetical protein
MKRHHYVLSGCICAIAMFAIFANDNFVSKTPQTPESEEIPQKITAQPIKYQLPSWLFDDPKGNNALITTSRLETSEKPLYQYTNYFQRFSPHYSKYKGKKTVLRVARTQENFDEILKTMVGEVIVPRKLDFSKELYLFIFNGIQNANEYTLVEVSEIDRNGGPIKLGNRSFVHPETGKRITMIDHIMVRAEVQIGKPEYVDETLSPWTMIRVNRETFFKEYPENDETKFILIESRNHIYTIEEQSDN